MRRLFFIALVLLLLLAHFALAQAINATVFTPSKFLGLVPCWELKESLPAGLFAAAAFAAAVGMGAQFWHGLLSACHAGDWAPRRELTRLGSVGLWCGWPLLAACLVSIAYLFPWAGDGSPAEGLYTRDHLLVQLYAGVALLAAVQVFQGLRHAALPATLAAAAVALSCGMMWWQGRALDYLAVALVAPLALVLLLPHREDQRKPLAWLLVAALALGAYAAGSQVLMAAYLPGQAAMPALSTGWATLTGGCAALAALLTLALALVPALHRRATALRAMAAAALLLCAAYSWCLFSAPVLQQHPRLVLTYPAEGVCACVYAVTLLLLTGLAFLRWMSSARPASSRENEQDGIS